MKMMQMLKSTVTLPLLAVVMVIVALVVHVVYMMPVKPTVESFKAELAAFDDELDKQDANVNGSGVLLPVLKLVSNEKEIDTVEGIIQNSSIFSVL